MKTRLSFIFFILTLNFYSQSEIYQTLLEKYVHPESGYVFYDKLKSDKKKLETYINYLASIAPEKNWSKNKEKAFWINVYNANILKIITENYISGNSESNNKIFSLKKENKGLWDIPFIKIKEKLYTLNNIEHDIIRKKFKDPRVHAAFNSASKSGCKIASYILTENNIDMKLEQLMTLFINDKIKNSITPGKIYISKIFDWYKDDFTSTGKSLIDYINKYSIIKIENDAEIEFLQFNWVLNDR